MKYLLLMLLLTAAPASAEGPLPPRSLYHLDAVLTNQAGAQHGLGVYRGHPVLVTLFYASCPEACPLLIDTLRAIESAATPAQRQALRVLLVTIDPAQDTVEKLLALARARHIGTSRWTLARTDEATVRKIAAVLNVQYRPLPGGGYNHSSIITVLTPEGEIAAQSSRLGKADAALLRALAAAGGG
jgi:protein SCO1